jgi:GMP synthase (glutamine-hydrolysing)
VTAHDTVLVVDFGAQYAQLIARRVREAKVYSEIVPHTMPVEEMLARQPKAIILSGGPSSVYESGAPQLDPALVDGRVPVFGICYGFMAMAQALGGSVAHTGQREYGRTRVEVLAPGTLLDGLPGSLVSWMSHGDEVVAAPAGFTVNARSPRATVAAFEDVDRKLAGVQWHPEVMHTEHGQAVLEHFLHDIAGCRPTWTMVNIVEEQIERIRTQIGLDGRAICGLSGGVDSAVAAAVVQRAIGDRLTCVFVDHGLLRKGEAEQVERDFVAATGVDLHVVDAEKRFLDALAGVRDPEEKRKVIGREFIRVFEAAEADVLAKKIGESAAASGVKVAFLVQGTLYPDVVESGGGAGTSNIKSHHNVGGLPDDLEFELVEPLRTLFKDEVRLVGEQLGLPAEIVWPRTARDPARGRRDCPRGAHPRRSGSRHLAVPRRTPRRRPLGGRAGRRPHLRPPGRAPPGDQRGRDDRRLGAAAVRRARDDLHPDHQRGRRGQPGHRRHHVQAARHHRVGVTRFSTCERPA